LQLPRSSGTSCSSSGRCWSPQSTAPMTRAPAWKIGGSVWLLLGDEAKYCSWPGWRVC